METRPRSGTRVSPLRLDEARQALAVISAMHELAVRTAVARLEARHLVRLAQAARDFEEAVKAGDDERAIDADDEFHGVFVTVADNGPLRETIERFLPLLRRAEALRFGTLPGRRSIAAHKRILAAARRGRRRGRGGGNPAQLGIAGRADRAVDDQRLGGGCDCEPGPIRTCGAAVRPLAGPPSRASQRASWRRRRNLGQARGLQLGSRVRREQGAQARVPRGRRAGHRAATRWSRSAASSPITPVRWRPWPRGLALAVCSCRSTGSTGPTRSTTRSGTSSSRGSWAPMSAWTRRALTSAFARAGRRRSSRSENEVARPTRSRPARLTIRSAGSASRVGPRRCASRSRSSTCSSTPSSSARSPAPRRQECSPASRHSRSRVACSASTARRPCEQTREQITRIARRTADAIGLDRELRDDEIILLDGWHAGCYGIPDAKTLEAIRLCARLEGMLTDPVYEGKSMAALIDLVRSGEIATGSRVLYAHLGGQPALNAYAGAF